MSSIEKLIGQSVALVDRGFIVAEGRIVYPTAEGVLKAVDAKAGTLDVQLRNDKEDTIFFIDSLRCVRAAPAPQTVQVEAQSQSQAE